ncbi:MAG: hypothetical protein IJR28_05665 [Ottowia sp.]|nr:hypothetical protein [Ottowia sp.]
MSQQRDLSDRERFRQLGRKMLDKPADLDRHELRVLAACELPGFEPAQGALADMLHVCEPDAERFGRLLARPEVAAHLPAYVLQAFQALVASGERLSKATPLATRYSVIATPSLDVPKRALLVSMDDSRTLAIHAVAAVQAGDTELEEEFLAHCRGAHDTLAFMLARRALMREGRVLGQMWEDTLQVLQ